MAALSFYYVILVLRTAASMESCSYETTDFRPLRAACKVPPYIWE